MNKKLQIFPEEEFNLDLEESATILDLKKELEDETNFVPERQELYFMGFHLDSNFDNVIVKELVEPFDVEFVLFLPKASQNSSNKKWLILGNDQKYLLSEVLCLYMGIMPNHLLVL